MTALRVLLATSSPTAQSRLTRELAALPEVAVCGRATELSGTYMLAEETSPEVALIGADLRLHPDFDGLMALFRLLGCRPVQILPAPAPGRGVWPGMPVEALRAELTRARPPVQPAPPQPLPQRFAPERLILIGASTGGIDALIQILSAFPADCPPTAVVQHTGQAFSDSLIRLLGRAARPQVLPAGAATPLRPGTILVGAGCAGHLRLRPRPPMVAELTPGPPVSGHMPSVDALFGSALPLAPRVTAALLTGMGRDGAQGLLDLRRAGAHTLAQDEASSVVYGMPRAAAELGAAERILPLDRIATELLALSAEPRARAAGQ